MSAGRSNEKPSFFKVLSNMDFTKLLRLPPSFLTKHELTLPEYVKLRAHSGRTWNVKVERLQNGLFCFTQGWQTFAEDAALQLGEFLVFTLVKKSKFDVVIYETSFCEREIPPTPFHGDDLEDSDHADLADLNVNDANKKGRPKELNDVGASEKSSNPLYFEICLKRHHKSRISLPAKFSNAAGMKGRKSVMVEYAATHDCKSVVVDHRWKTQLNRFDLTIGWRQFLEANGLGWGNKYSFEFNPNLNFIHVNPLNN